LIVKVLSFSIQKGIENVWKMVYDKVWKSCTTYMVMMVGKQWCEKLWDTQDRWIMRHAQLHIDIL